MNKAEFIEKFSKSTGKSKTDSEAIFNTVITIFEKELLENKEVTLSSLGKLKVKPTKARKGRNPKTGEIIEIPASRKVFFVCAKEFKNKL